MPNLEFKDQMSTLGTLCDVLETALTDLDTQVDALESPPTELTDAVAAVRAAKVAVAQCAYY